MLTPVHLRMMRAGAVNTLRLPCRTHDPDLASALYDTNVAGCLALMPTESFFGLSHPENCGRLRDVPVVVASCIRVSDVTFGSGLTSFIFHTWSQVVLEMSGFDLYAHCCGAPQTLVGGRDRW